MDEATAVDAALNGFIPSPRDVLDLRESETPLKAWLAKQRSIYDPSLVVAICERIAMGEPIRKICRDPGMPHRASIYRWLIEHEEFRDVYTLAVQCRIDDMADECLEIADDGSQDLVLNDKAVLVVNQDVIARTKIRLAERHWWLACTAPKKYGKAPEPQLETASEPGDDARDVSPNGGGVIGEHPLAAALEAWNRVRAS